MDYMYILNNNRENMLSIAYRHFSDNEWYDFKIYRFCYMTLTRIAYNFLPLIFSSDAYNFGTFNIKSNFIVKKDSITGDNKKLDDVYVDILMSYEDNYFLAYNVLELYNYGYFKGVYLDENEHKFRKIKNY